jgi:hypothetical protein
MSDSRARAQADAIDGVLEVFRDWGMLPFPSFTCGEAERLAAFAEAFGQPGDGARFLYGHSTTDDSQEDEHHGMADPDDG